MLPYQITIIINPIDDSNREMNTTKKKKSTEKATKLRTESRYDKKHGKFNENDEVKSQRRRDKKKPQRPKTKYLAGWKECVSFHWTSVVAWILLMDVLVTVKTSWRSLERTMKRVQRVSFNLRTGKNATAAAATAMGPRLTFSNTHLTRNEKQKIVSTKKLKPNWNSLDQKIVKMLVEFSMRFAHAQHAHALSWMHIVCATASHRQRLIVFISRMATRDIECMRVCVCVYAVAGSWNIKR